VLFRSDITARKAAESQLVAHALELSRSNRELEHFAYVASHDLQEPLRTVSGFAQLLARRYQGRLDGDADEYLGYITDGVKRMKSLIEDLLAYSRVQRAETPPAPVALDRVLDTTLANLAGAISAAGATIHRTPLPTLPVDAAQLAQLFQNLIGNAIKFRSSTPPEIDVEAQCSGLEWRFSIRDNGIGIAAGSIERVFDLFQRGHTREQYEGNGIGLTICKKIVELHGGHIWVAPREDGASGCQFCFTLPLPASP
jgi:light-regulated signal transduction histidine kinase (bacteriophytochrome)